MDLGVRSIENFFTDAPIAIAAHDGDSGPPFAHSLRTAKSVSFRASLAQLLAGKSYGYQSSPNQATVGASKFTQTDFASVYSYIASRPNSGP